MTGGVGGQTHAGFRPDIQGLRAIAVVAVVLYHAGVPFLPGGYVGVDVFFVISGFLITSHLLRRLETGGRVGFADFYAKRARRILPAALVVLILSVLAAIIWYPPYLLKDVAVAAIATAAYVPNFLFASNGTNYLAEETPSLFQHYWSLGVEEQFYLVWPLVLALCWKYIRSRRVIFVLLTSLTALSFALCVVLTHWKQPWAFFLLPTRAWELAAGGLLAFILLRRGGGLGRGPSAVLGWVGLGAIVCSTMSFSADTIFPGYWAAVPVLGTACVILAGAKSNRHGPARLLSSRPMVGVGAISYSLYLVHWPALLITQAALGFTETMPLWIGASVALLCLPLAWGLYRIVEGPVRSAPWLLSARPRRSLVGALAISGICAFASTGVIAYADVVPLHAGRSVVASSPSTPPSVTDYVPSNMMPSLRVASEDIPVVYRDGCHRNFDSTDAGGCLYGDVAAPRIVVFGDSHAAQWVPALMVIAEQKGYALQTFTKSACPSVTLSATDAPEMYPQCEEWRERVIEKLVGESPDLIVMSNYSGNFPTVRSDDWERALRLTLERLGAPTVVIADTPDMGTTPGICLSAHVADASACAVASQEALNPQIREAESAAAVSSGAALIDLTDYLCTDYCAPIIGDALVYRDDHHLTATFSERLAPVLSSYIFAAAK